MIKTNLFLFLVLTGMSSHVTYGDSLNKLTAEEEQKMLLEMMTNNNTQQMQQMGKMFETLSKMGKKGHEQADLNNLSQILTGQSKNTKDKKELDNIFSNMMKISAEQQKAQIKHQQKEFNKKFKGHGKAQLKFNKESYDLVVTECLINNSKENHFKILAKFLPGSQKGDLSIYAKGRFGTSQIQLRLGRQYFNRNDVDLNIEKNKLDWSGSVTSLEGTGKDDITIKVQCGDEMVILDQPTLSSMPEQANIFNFHIAGERYLFEAGYCSSNKRRDGNLMVLFEATATGLFRGKPAIILLNRSHPVGAPNNLFQSMSLLLGELDPLQRKLSPLKVKKLLDDVVSKNLKQKMTAYNKKYNQKYFNSFSPEELNKALQTSQEEMSAIMDESKAMRYPIMRGFPEISLDANKVLVKGIQVSIDRKPVPQFKGLSTTNTAFELQLLCGA